MALSQNQRDLVKHSRSGVDEADAGDPASNSDASDGYQDQLFDSDPILPKLSPLRK